ncbi:TolC family protein [Tepidibacter sp. Z1-5]|uniref:TolC family protein n=1 Tax=Tepidibacter sp. Z1-5 TaxID=3134138 RepID=UPI0030BDED28
MKKVILGTFLLCILITSSTGVYAQDKSEDIKKLSIEEAIKEGIKNSNEIKLSDLDIQIKEIELNQANYREKKYKKGNNDNFSGTIEGFQLDANMVSKNAEYEFQEEKIKKEYKIENLKYNITKYYYLAIQARDKLFIAQNNLENVENNKNIVNKKFDAGLASKSDLIMADINLSEAKTTLERASNDAKKSLRELNKQLSYSLDTEIELTSDFNEADFLSDLNKDLEKAYKNRFDMIKIKNKYEIAKLDFETNAIKYSENTYTYKYKERNVVKVENLLKEVKSDVEFDIKSKYDEVNVLKRQIDIAKYQVEKEKEQLRLKQSSYNAGMTTLIEVKQAFNNLYKAQIYLDETVSNYNLSILDYNKCVSIGEIG